MSISMSTFATRRLSTTVGSHVTTAKRLPAASSAHVRPSVLPSKKPLFLVILPDKPGSLNRRMELRPVHLKEIYPNVEEGSLKIGGPLLNELPKDDYSTPDIYGSCVIWSANSKEEVLDVLKRDIYVQKGVWDIEKIQIFPFRPTFSHQFDNGA